MQQETASDFALFQIVDELLVFFCSQGRGNERLGFTTREKRRTVNARQPADFGGDGPDFRKPAAVWTATVEFWPLPSITKRCRSADPALAAVEYAIHLPSGAIWKALACSAVTNCLIG